MAEKKMVLRRRTEELMYMAKGILAKHEEFEDQKDDVGFCQRFKKSKGIKNKKKELKVEYIKLEKELEVYDIENTLKANPLLDVLKLVLGIVLSVLSLIFWIHILLYKLITKNDQPISGMLNDFMLMIEFKIARFFSTIIFIVFGKLPQHHNNNRHLLHLNHRERNHKIRDAFSFFHKNPPHAKGKDIPEFVHLQPAVVVVLCPGNYSFPN
jgi:hypothetical protein